MEDNRPRKAKVDENFSGGSFLSKKVLDKHCKETEAAAAAKKSASKIESMSIEMNKGTKSKPSGVMQDNVITRSSK